MSFILFSSYNKKLKVACPGCLDKANNKALLKTAILGWWGLTWGIVYSVQSLALNIDSQKTNHLSHHNYFLRSFALSNIGEIETYIDDVEKLQHIIANHNSL